MPRPRKKGHLRLVAEETGVVYPVGAHPFVHNVDTLLHGQSQNIAEQEKALRKYTGFAAPRTAFSQSRYDPQGIVNRSPMSPTAEVLFDDPTKISSSTQATDHLRRARHARKEATDSLKISRSVKDVSPSTDRDWET